MRHSPFVPLLALAGGFAIVPPALIHFVGGDKVHVSSTVHFWAVGLSASIAIAAGVALSSGGQRRGDARAAPPVLPAIRERRSVVPLLWLQAALMAGVLALGGSALLVPSLVPSVPEPSSSPALATLVAGLVFFAWLRLRALPP